MRLTRAERAATPEELIALAKASEASARTNRRDEDYASNQVLVHKSPWAQQAQASREAAWRDEEHADLLRRAAGITGRGSRLRRFFLH